jgi:hypothetical protein
VADPEPRFVFLWHTGHAIKRDERLRNVESISFVAGIEGRGAPDFPPR